MVSQPVTVVWLEARPMAKTSVVELWATAVVYIQGEQALTVSPYATIVGLRARPIVKTSPVRLWATAVVYRQRGQAAALASA